MTAMKMVIKLGDPPARALAASERLSASVRFRAVTGRPSRQLPRLGCARTGREQSQQGRPLIRSPRQRERASRRSSRPSILAVWALITSSNLVDCTTGRSAGFAPLRMLPV